MFIHVSGKRIHYEQIGKGPPLLFVHGWGGTSMSLLPLARLFTGHDAVILDLPGFGKSDLPDSSWGVEEYANLANQFCLQLGLKNITYFGHSFGGSLGIYLTAHFPALIKKLILCNSSFKREVKISKISLLLKSLAKYVPFLLRQEAKLKQLYYRLFLRRSDLYRFPLLEPNLRKIVLQDLTRYLSMINIPTLIIWGSADKDTPVNMAYELKQKIKGSKIKIFEGVTHGLPLKYPKLVYKEIMKFL